MTTLCMGFPLFSWGQWSTSVLPNGVTSPSLRLGKITQMDQRYTDSGALTRSGDLKSVEFDSSKLSSIEPKVKDLVNALNAFGAYKLGSSLHFGTLKIDTRPEVDYTAMVWAHGFTSQWTLGLGIPVIHYKNRIGISQTNSNLDFYRDYAQRSNDPRLQQAVQELDKRSNLPEQLQTELKAKSYEALESQDSTFLGDLQLSSLYRFYEDKKNSALYRLNVNLPTGPDYNADNLAALNQFGRTYLESLLVYDQEILQPVRVTPYLGLRWYVPDQVQMRVPQNEEDLLPDADSKENVSRQLGQIWIAGSSMQMAVGNYSLMLAYEYQQKKSDSYSGTRGRRYDLLSANTATKQQLASGGVTYSTVSNYRKNKNIVPWQASLLVSDIFAGENVDRQLTQELSLMMFF